MKFSATHYEILGVSETATLEEIKAARRRLLLETHPDRAVVDQNNNAADKINNVQVAYNILSKAQDRANYDKYLYKLRDWQNYPDIFQDVLNIALSSQDLESLRELKAYMDSEEMSFDASVAFTMIEHRNAINLRWLLTEGEVDLSSNLLELTLKAIEYNFLEGFELLLEFFDMKKLAKLKFKVEKDESDLAIGDINTSLEEINLIKYIVKKGNSLFLKTLINKDISAFNLDVEVFPNKWKNLFNRFNAGLFAKDSLPLFFYSIVRNDVEMLRTFKELGANVNIVDHQERNALIFVVSHFQNSAEILSTLLDLGVDMNQQMYRGHYGDFDTAPRAHNENQANINRILSNKFCALSLAVYTHDYESINVFLDAKYIDNLSQDTLSYAISLASVLTNYNTSREEANRFERSLKLLEDYRYKYYRYNVLRLQYDRRPLNGAADNSSLRDKIGYAIPEILHFTLKAIRYSVPILMLSNISIDIPELRPLLPILGAMSMAGFSNDFFALNIPTRIKNSISLGFDRLRTYWTPKPTNTNSLENSPTETPQINAENTPSEPVNYSSFMGFSPYKAGVSLLQSAQTSFASAQKMAANNVQYYKKRFGYE